MRPLLALTIRDVPVDPEYVADVLNQRLDREFAGERVSVRLLRNEEELRQYMAGELILYRRPARRRGNVISYQKDGVEHRLEQLTLEGGQREGPSPDR